MIFSLLATLSSMQAFAENYVPLTTENFSEGMIKCLKSLTSMQTYIKTIDGVECINVDGPSSTLTLDSSVVDSRGLRLFKNITTLTVLSTVKFLDMRGLTKLKFLTIGGVNVGVDATKASSNPSALKENTAAIETILADSTALETFRIQRFINLRFLSLRECTKLTDVYADGCDLMGLDLSSCTNIKVVNVISNMHMSWLRLPETAPMLTQIHACHTNLLELNIPRDMGKSISTSARTINIDNSKIQRVNLNNITILSGGTSLQSFKFANSNLLCIPIQSFYKGSTWDTSSTHSVNVGYLDRVLLAEATDLVDLKNKNIHPSFSGASGGVIEKDEEGNVYFKFNDNVTTGKYTTATTQSASVKVTATVTLVRTLEKPEMYLRFVQDNTTLDSYYDKYMKDLVDVVGSYEDGTNMYADIPMEHVSGNDYTLYMPVLLGNFVFVQKDPTTGKETIIGANSADVSAHYHEWQVGHVHASPTRGNAETSARATELYDYALHRYQPQEKLIDHYHTSKTSMGTFKEAHPWTFSTHSDEAAGNLGRLEKVNINLSYAADQTAGHVTFSTSNGTVTGINEITVDNIIDNVDEDAPVEYYDLQGRRVMNPANGIFIERRGSHVTKRLMH